MDAFFVTGTGRCGTMLVARLLSLGNRAVCEHEQHFRHQSMVDYHLLADPSSFNSDIADSFEPKRCELASQGRAFGVASGHLYFAIPRLWEVYGDSARYILLVRRPDGFARSAAARGFFDPQHPNYCDQLQPNAKEPIARTWNEASVLERNLWYWSLVNGFVLDAFAKLPPHVTKVVRAEELDVDTCLDLCEFLDLADISREDVAGLLSRRINASPGQAGDSEDNPYSQPITMPELAQWEPWQRELLERYTGDLERQLYA